MAKGSSKGSPKGSPKKGSPKGSPKKGSSKGSPDKKSKKSGKNEPPPPPPYIPIREIDLHPNFPVKLNNLHWLTGPGFTFIMNYCYTKEEAMHFRDFFNLPLWDHLTLDAHIDEYCRECIHGNCKDWPGAHKIKPEKTVMERLFEFWDLNLPIWDYLEVDKEIDNYKKDCCIHRNVTNIKDVIIPAIPNGPRYVNTHNIKTRPPTILKPIPPKNLGVGYTYIRNLGLKDKYQEAIIKEIQKSYLVLKPVDSVNTTMIKRGTSKNKLGLVLTVLPGPNCFAIYVIKGLPAYAANIEFGDQLLDVDGLPLQTKLALNRLTENKSIVINVIYTKCPFKLYYKFQIPIGDSLGFQIVDGNIIRVDYDSPAQKAELPLNYQIVELDKECIVGLTNTELKREIRNRASQTPHRQVSMTVIPRIIYQALIGRLDTKYIRDRALKENNRF